MSAARQRSLKLEGLVGVQQRLIGRLRSAIGHADSVLKDEGDVIDRACRELGLKPTAQVENPLHYAPTKAKPAVLVAPSAKEALASENATKSA